MKKTQIKNTLTKMKPNLKNVMSTFENKAMVSGRITKDGMSKSKVDPCGVCSLRAKANPVLHEQYGKRLHSRCAGEKR